MSDFLKKIKLMDNLNVELNISKLEFVKALRNHIEISDLGIFSDFSDIFSSTKKEFKGKVDNKGFILKRKRRFLDSKRNSTAKALGSFKEIENKLIINSEIKGINNKMYFFIVSAIMFYSVFISVFFLKFSEMKVELLLSLYYFMLV